MQPNARPFTVPLPGRNAPVHEWCNYMAFQFADQARSGEAETLTPEQSAGMAHLLLELGQKALAAHMALVRAGIDPAGLPNTFGGNVAYLPEISAERARSAITSLFSSPPTAPNGGNAA